MDSLAGDKRRDGGMEGWMDGGMDGEMEGWMERWREGWRDGWRDGGMDGWQTADWPVPGVFQHVVVLVSCLGRVSLMLLLSLSGSFFFSDS